MEVVRASPHGQANTWSGLDQQREQERPQRRQNEAVSVRPKQTLPWRQAQQAHINQQREEAWHDDLEQLEARKQARQELETQLEEMRRMLQLVEREQEWGVQEGQAQNQEQKQQQLHRLQGQVKKMEQRLQGLRMIELQEQQDIHQEAVTARYTQNRRVLDGQKQGQRPVIIVQPRPGLQLQAHPVDSTCPNDIIVLTRTESCKLCGGSVQKVTPAWALVLGILLGLICWPFCFLICIKEKQCKECSAVVE